MEVYPTTVQDTAPTRYPPVNATVGDMTLNRMVHNEITFLGMLRFSLRWVLIPLSDNTRQSNSIDSIEIAATETGLRGSMQQGGLLFWVSLK